jgi:hypothetical protein
MMPEEKVKILETVINEVPSDQEKKTVLWALPNYPCPAAVELAKAMNRNETLREDAEKTANRIQSILAKRGRTASRNQ